MATDLLAELLSPYRRAVAGEEYDLSLDPIYGTLAQFAAPTSAPGGSLESLLDSSGGGTKAQLIQGFLDAGRADLAKMVRTDAFDTWIGQESGWRVNAQSPANNQGKPNHWLFQFWEGHPWVQNIVNKGQTPSAYQQAKLAAKHFPHLDPDDIRDYARQIRAGNYPGWG